MDLIEQSVMVSGIVYVFLGFVVHDWSCAVELTNYRGPHWAIDNYRPFNYLSDFAGNWLKVSTRIRMTSVKSFLNQTTHSIVMTKSPNALYMSLIGWGGAY